MSTRPYETYVIDTDLGGYELHEYAGQGKDSTVMLTPGGFPIKHSSDHLITEITSELKIAGSDVLIKRLSNYQLLCSQIDEYEHGEFSRHYQKKQITEMLLRDGVFSQMHPPEEVERRYNLEVVGLYLSEVFRSDSDEADATIGFGAFVTAYFGANAKRGKLFTGLRDVIHCMVNKATLDQRVVIHSAFHLCNSLLVSVLLAAGMLTPRQFGLAAYACQSIIPDILDEEETAEMLDHLDLLAGYVGMFNSYLDNSVSTTERLVEQGEGMYVEFKSTFRRNLHTDKNDKDIETAALKEIVGFMNTLGGHLIIGVSDDGSILGMGNDGFQNHDRFQTHVSNQLANRVGADMGKYLKFHFDKVTGNVPILRIQCEQLPETITGYLDGEVYIRNASQTVKLTTQETMEWNRNRGGDS